MLATPPPARPSHEGRFIINTDDTPFVHQFRESPITCIGRNSTRCPALDLMDNKPPQWPDVLVAGCAELDELFVNGKMAQLICSHKGTRKGTRVKIWPCSSASPAHTETQPGRSSHHQVHSIAHNTTRSFSHAFPRSTVVSVRRTTCLTGQSGPGRHLQRPYLLRRSCRQGPGSLTRPGFS